MEIGLPMLRVEQFDESSNLACLLINLNLLNETRDKARLRMTAYRQRVARHSTRM